MLFIVCDWVSGFEAWGSGGAPVFLSGLTLPDFLFVSVFCAFVVRCLSLNSFIEICNLYTKKFAFQYF